LRRIEEVCIRRQGRKGSALPGGRRLAFEISIATNINRRYRRGGSVFAAS
jgi:DNA-binding transcriptional regulator YhcF (GntR family)